MHTSENGICFIAGNEGFCATVTPDSKGKLQIGHGHDLSAAELAAGTWKGGITPAQADALLRADLAATYEPAVNRLASQANQNQFDALVDFCYNLGPGDLATMLHHGFYQAPLQMPAWCYEEVDGVEQKSEGLEARRQKEVALFQTLA